MVSSRPTTPKGAKSAAGDSSDVATTHAGETSPDVASKPDASKPDDPQQKPSTLRTVLLLISVFGTMFLVALDRTIISTV